MNPVEINRRQYKRIIKDSLIEMHGSIKTARKLYRTHVANLRKSGQDVSRIRYMLNLTQQEITGISVWPEHIEKMMKERDDKEIERNERRNKRNNQFALFTMFILFSPLIVGIIAFIAS